MCIHVYMWKSCLLYHCIKSSSCTCRKVVFFYHCEVIITVPSPLSGETPESLFKGKLVTCTVVGIVRRKPPREVLDRAHPIENKATGYWQCPFCLKADFRELSMVRTCTTTRLTNLWCRECEIYKHKQSKHNHVTDRCYFSSTCSPFVRCGSTLMMGAVPVRALVCGPGWRMGCLASSTPRTSVTARSTLPRKECM